MSAALELQIAAVAALRAAAGIAGTAQVHDGAPADAALPYLVFGDGLSFDWSTKTHVGREHRLIVLVWDEAGRTARLQGLVAAAEGALAALPKLLPGHRVVSNVAVRSRIVRERQGPWAGLVEQRVRTMEI